MATMEFFSAEASEQVRSAQKDRHVTGYLSSILSDMVSPYMTQHTWLRWQREVQLLAELVYYSLTTVRGDQTLGEEYGNIVQVSPGARREAPGLARRLSSIMLHVMCRYAVERGLSHLSDAVRNRSLWYFRLSERHYKQLQSIVDMLYEIIVNANQLHLAIFYLYGTYYYLGKRLTGIKYLMIRYHTHLPSSNPYKVLGWLILVQLAYKLFKLVLTHFKHSSRGDQDAEDLIVSRDGAAAAAVSRTIKCALCLEHCADATVGPCGHTYCWRCIMEWLKQQRLCPTCRTVMLPRQLVLLQNFELSSN